MQKITISLLILFLTPVLNASEYKVYFGNLHAHCSHSDGKGTALEAYTYARDVAKLDFFSLTDHMEQLTQDELKAMIDAADTVRVEGVFETLWGFEWGSPIYNHSNMFMTEHFYSIDCYINDHINKFYTELLRYRPAFMQFNHPDYNPELPMYNYRQYNYREDVDEIISLIEVKSAFDEGDREELSYIQALDKGWHLSPVYNQDNHNPDWGTQNDCRAAVWLKSLTRDNLIEGLRNGRTYSTCNKNVVVRWLCEGKWAGETIFNKENVACELIVSDPDEGDIYTSADIVTSGGVVYDTISGIKKGETVRFNLKFSESNRWYYLRIRMDSRIVVWTAPFYYEKAGDSDA
ncbi:MAG: CehA/McbA family metallohydrolase, partial [Deltaproteobacteria bacterium]|nr:CehA/McbA family metallohydrolase [Deltaproteobacteria bacterium]